MKHKNNKLRNKPMETYGFILLKPIGKNHNKVELTPTSRHPHTLIHECLFFEVTFLLYHVFPFEKKILIS